MADLISSHADWIYYGFFLALILIVVAPVRNALIWLIKEAGALKHLGGYLVTGLHHLWVAHLTVLRNFAPRSRIYMQLGRKRTSQTMEQ